jgi:CheY-like chemotaxis protein
MGIEIEIAENGQVVCEKAVQSRAEGHPYDLILMDMQMPEMDGLQATQWLREHDWQGPIIAVTAHAMSEHRDGCIAAGCDDYLTKPVQVDDLRAMLARHIHPSADKTAIGPSQSLR